MPLDQEQYQQIADELWNASASTGTSVPPSKRFAEFSIEDGYVVGSPLAERRLSAGDLRAGLNERWSVRPNGADLPALSVEFGE